MAQSLISLVAVSNLGVSGDIGGITFYNSAQGKIIAFPASPPKEPPSAAQLVMRQRWRLAMKSWSNLSAQQRSTWRQAVTRAGLKISAPNLWLWYQLYRDRATMATIERQSGSTLPGL
jgi:hypothetical protein